MVLAQLPVTAAGGCYNEEQISRNWGPPLASPDPLLEKSTAGGTSARPHGVNREEKLGRAHCGEESE